MSRPWPRTAAQRGVLALAWLASWWLLRRPSNPDPIGVLWNPTASLALVMLVTWLLPGYLLWRRAAVGDWLQGVAFSAALGLSWLILPAALALALCWDVGRFGAVVVGLNGLLTLAAILRPGAAVLRGSRRVDPSLAVVVMSTCAFLVAVAAAHPGFTAAGDDWFLMRTIRYFLEARPITDTHSVAAWELCVALLVKMARVDLVASYRSALVPLLVPLAFSCVVALARAVLPGTRARVLAVLLLALHCLSDMNTRGDGVGMALLVRIVEDRYLSLLVLTPAALAAFLWALRTGGRMSAVAAALAVAAVVMHPPALAWLAAGTAGPALATLAMGRRRPSWRVGVLAAVAVALCLASAWWLRSLRPLQSFQLLAPGWELNPRLAETARRQLIVFSSAPEWYMVHPRLLSHPLTLAALALALGSLGRVRGSRSASFLCFAMLLPVVVALNPLSATWLGQWMAPWSLPRLLWALPVTLVLAHGIDAAGTALERRPGWPRWGSSGAAALAAALMLGLLAPLVQRSMGALAARNRTLPGAGERELMRSLAADSRLAGPLVAPTAMSVRVPAWSSRFVPYPGPDLVRVDRRVALEEFDRFYAARTLEGPDLEVIRRIAPRVLVVAASGSRLDRLLTATRGFQSVIRQGEFSVYQWRADWWWPEAPP